MPAEFQTDGGRCALLRILVRYTGRTGLNYTHVTVLNSATERTGDRTVGLAGGQAGGRAFGSLRTRGTLNSGRTSARRS